MKPEQQSDYYIDEHGNLKYNPDYIEVRPNYFNISVFFLIVVHLVGLIGLLSPVKEMFLKLTPFNLLLSIILLLSFQKIWNKNFIIWVVIVFLSGFFVEVLGVKTGKIFGVYSYGETLGPKLFEVPVMIGVNWLMLAYASATLVNKLNITKILKAVLAAILMVFLDFLIEPIAIKNDFWSWENNIIPVQNFIAWFVVSFLMQLMCFYQPINKFNPFGLVLYLVQICFFLLLLIFQ